MSTTTSTSKKKSIWNNNTSPYGTYSGSRGTPESWKTAFQQALYSREKTEEILKNTVLTPYDILQSTPKTPITIIESNWRKLCILNHPDKGGDRNKFELIMAAWSHIKEKNS